MSFSNKIKGRGNVYGYKNSLIFFGNENFNDPHKILGNSFISSLHQIHGKTIIQASQKKEKADGQWTQNINQYLIIKTADCMPVFIGHPNKIVALHIGWRGLMQKILTDSLKLYRNKKDIQIFVGPHIQYNSFQMDMGSTKSLLIPHKLSIKSALKEEIIKPSFSQKEHFFINLKKILIKEGARSGLKENQFTFSPIDTYSSPFHYSHRRNRNRKGQNFSFIVQT